MGQMGMFSGKKRLATIVDALDSTLVEITEEALNEIEARKLVFPTKIIGQIIDRLSKKFNSISTHTLEPERPDLHLNPNVSRFGFANWRAYVDLVKAGYDHAIEVFYKLPPEKTEALKNGISLQHDG